MVNKIKSITSSHTAGISLRGLMEKARNDPHAKRLFWVGMAVGMIPVVGGAISYGIDRHRNTVIEKKQKQVLAGYYRDQVAMQLGIDPNSVGLSDLELAAKVNPMIAGAIDKVNNEKKSANRSSAMASAGTTAVGLIPGIGGVAGAAAKTTAYAVTKEAARFGGGIAGSAASSLFDKKVLHVSDMVEHIDAKRTNGEAVTATDIALLRIAQDEKLQKQIKDHYKKALHQMTELEQQQALSQMPDLLMGANKQVDALNRGLISPQNLVMAGPESTSSFTETVSRQSSPQSFVAMEDQRRAAAAQQGATV